MARSMADLEDMERKIDSLSVIDVEEAGVVLAKLNAEFKYDFDEEWYSRMVSAKFIEHIKEVLRTTRTNNKDVKESAFFYVATCKAHLMLEELSKQQRCVLTLILVAAVAEQHAKELCRCGYRIWLDWAFWGLPSTKALRVIADVHEKAEKPARVVDMGCGTGAWTAILNKAKVRTIGVELPAGHPSREQAKAEYSLITTDYIQEKNDILLIVWGRFHMDKVVFDFVAQGGTCVIIVGQADFGCTLSTEMKIPGFSIRKNLEIPSMMQGFSNFEYICVHMKD